MKLTIISAFCLIGILRIFCSLLLRDKTFLGGKGKPTYVSAVCIALAAMGGACGGGYICLTAVKTLASPTLLTAVSAVAAAVLAVILAFIAKKIYKISGVYFPAIILCAVLSSVMTAITFSGESMVDLAVAAAVSAVTYGLTFTLWHGLRLGTEKVKHGYILEAVCAVSAVTVLFSVL